MESYIKFQQDDYDYVKIIKNEAQNEEPLEVVKLLMTLMFMCVPGLVQGYATQLWHVSCNGNLEKHKFNPLK